MEKREKVNIWYGGSSIYEEEGEFDIQAFNGMGYRPRNRRPSPRKSLAINGELIKLLTKGRAKVLITDKKWLKAVADGDEDIENPLNCNRLSSDGYVAPDTYAWAPLPKKKEKENFKSLNRDILLKGIK